MLPRLALRAHHLHVLSAARLFPRDGVQVEQGVMQGEEVPVADVSLVQPPAASGVTGFLQLEDCAAAVRPDRLTHLHVPHTQSDGARA